MEKNKRLQIAVLKKKIEKSLHPDRLQELTRSVIQTHQAGKTASLLRYAKEAGLLPEAGDIRDRTLFYRIVRTIHPDQLPSLVKRFNTALKTGNLKELEQLDALLVLQPQALELNYREEHVWDASDMVFSGDEDDASRWAEAEELSFLDAVKLYAMGNLDLEISPFELAQLDGTLDVSRYGLYDLDGAELCGNVTILDASWNHLDSVTELRDAEKLVELYLAGNSIYDISPLAGLSSLELLDLEGNEIEDISPLLEIGSLQFVNLKDNPVENKELLVKLRESGLVVLV